MNNSLPIKLQPSNLRPIAYRVLSKKHGLNIQTDGLKVLTDVISYKFGSEWKSSKSQLYLEDIAKFWKSQDKGLFIDGEGLKEVIKQLDSNEPAKKVVNEENKENEVIEEEEINWKDYFKIINPDEQPNYRFDKDRKQFTLEPPAKLSNFLSSSVNYFNNRYNLIKDRLSRNETYQRTNYQSISNLKTKKHTKEITLIKNIIGKNGEYFLLFGLLSRNPQGRYILEDSSDSIELNLNEAEKTVDAFLTEGMLLIVEGLYSQYNENSNGGLFRVITVMQPPIERREISMENYGNLDFLNINLENLANLGHVSKINRSFKRKLVQLEKTLVDNKIIVLGSNLYLDDLKVLKGLRKFFNKLEAEIINEEPPPLTLILLGSFTSQPLSSVKSSVSSISNSELYKNYFNSFVTLLTEYPNIIQKVKFTLVPGPNDPWQSTYSLGSSNLNHLPQSPVASVFLNRLERVLPRGHLKLAWNPVRINYLSQEIVLFKDDLITKFRRNDIILQNEGKTEALEPLPPQLREARRLIKTLLDQGHLQPFSKASKLVNPIYDYTLRIEPLPTVLLLSDSRFDNFELPYAGCKVANVTQFLSNDKVTYLEYYMHNKSFKFKELYV